jgi:hypothetical protein
LANKESWRRTSFFSPHSDLPQLVALFVKHFECPSSACVMEKILCYEIKAQTDFSHCLHDDHSASSNALVNSTHLFKDNPLDLRQGKFLLGKVTSKDLVLRTAALSIPNAIVDLLLGLFSSKDTREGM